MLNKPIVHEFDNNLVYLRNKEMELHLKKLNQIKSRKNAFASTMHSNSSLGDILNNNHNLNITKRKNSPDRGFRIVQNYFIDRDNRYLCDKLYEISCRNNNYLRNCNTGINNIGSNNNATSRIFESTINSPRNNSKSKLKLKINNFKVHKKLNEKKIVEENIGLLKRLAEK
jgi:hypothetical protein